MKWGFTNQWIFNRQTLLQIPFPFPLAQLYHFCWDSPAALPESSQGLRAAKVTQCSSENHRIFWVSCWVYKGDQWWNWKSSKASVRPGPDHPNNCCLGFHWLIFSMWSQWIWSHPQPLSEMWLTDEFVEKPRPEKALLGHKHQCKESVHPEIKSNSNCAVIGIIAVHRQSRVCKERLFWFFFLYFFLFFFLMQSTREVGSTDKTLDTHAKVWWRVYLAWKPCQIKWLASWYLSEGIKIR